MEKITNKKTLFLLSIGIFIIAASVILPNFFKISDFSRGLLVGTGIGFIIKSDLFSIF
ncbi:hypothetical protein [Flavobacterium ginsenosidimutans]|uniref:Uncharacterized protein n=1 Tax=Flavobacterium ginsenosidimutans TaxID=687844 RepID=A0ABZ2Q4H0_9FLAO|nr:hypothetical protein [Flavobacterium ginsenosidimutans]KAF2326459.1 hypothetical protein DM444_21440 [Flavobacterium ginsenosidimutans]